ncbi:RICIN domain-containing protein [Streptomyces laurentii]|uniref:RICIN domain-containing protein n=1 Tax=Streptomyces laurentii TaxID=39478 RepID=UPI0036C21BE6
MRSSLRRTFLAVMLALAGLVLAPATAQAGTPSTVLFNQASERCPDGALWGTQDEHPCAPSDNPGQWVFTPVAGLPSVYTLNNAADQRSCLTNFDGLSGSQCSGGTNQMWRITPFTAPGNTPKYDMLGVRLQNIADSNCLDNTKKNFGGFKLYMFPCNDGPYQQWNIYRSTFEALFGGVATHNGMTWATLEQRADNVVHVGYDTNSNPYSGDTPASAVLPVLCLRQDGRPAPAGVPTGGYDSWAGGEVRATIPTPGTQLSSRSAADQLCASYFGAGFRMAEFHDGQGWSLWANGTLPANTRFWTAINDQPANPWS